jgi:nicotinamidase-related amidase
MARITPDRPLERLTRDRPLDPRRTALLFVDVQESEIDAATRSKHPFYYETVTRTAVPQQVRILAAARAAGCEVIYTVIEALTRDGRDRSLDHKLSDIFVPRGSPLARVIAAVAPAEDDIVLPKTSSGVFNSTNLDYVLRNLGIENLIVVGFVTDQCVDMAVRDGADRGYYVTCVADACAAYSAERHDAALRAFGGYCRVVTTDEILREITAGG